MKSSLLRLLALIISITFLAFDRGKTPNETIRISIENQQISPMIIEGDLIFCVKSLSKFYQDRMFSLAWENKKAIDQLVNSVKAAETEGLNPADYHFEKLKLLSINFSHLNQEQKAHLDLLATDAFLLYTSDLLSGKVNPTSIDTEWHVKRREGNPDLLFQEAIKNNTIEQTINGLLPQHEIYKGLKRALLNYEELKQAGGWESIPQGEPLKMGSEDDRIGYVKKRLVKTKDLSKDDMGQEHVYDDKLSHAIRRFQKRHNLEVDGTVGKLTVLAMNVPVEARIQQIKVNMERWRWLPQTFSNYYVQVNIANYSVGVFKEGEDTRYYKAIVGKEYRRTPVFSSKISYLVLNPTWTVPPGIISGDVLPAQRKDPNYLKKKSLTVLDSKGNVLDPNGVDWNSAIVKSYTYRQAAGPDNALGAVKFMFPNSFNVYLHDTPSRDLFEKTERSFSSGCIRVQNPLHLAQVLLNDSVLWNFARIKKQIELGKTLTLSLKEQPDIHILYWTAWADEDGMVQFRKDVYNRDNAVLAALEAKK